MDFTWKRGYYSSVMNQLPMDFTWERGYYSSVMNQLPIDFTTSIFLVTMYITRPICVTFVYTVCILRARRPGNRAEKVVYGKFTDKSTTVYDYQVTS